MPGKKRWVVLALLVILAPLRASAEPWRPVRAGDAWRVDITLAPVALEAVSAGGEAWDHVVMPGAGRTTRIGRPELPLIHRLVAVPAGWNLNARVTAAERETLHGVRALPWQRPAMRDGSGAGPFTVDRDFYDTDAVWPADEVRVGEAVIVGGERFVPVTIYPARLDPARGELTVITRLTLELSLTPSAARTDVPRRAVASRTTARALGDLAVRLPDSDGRAKSGDAEDDAPNWEPRDGLYLILCWDDFCDAAQPLADWKAQKGLPVDVVPLSAAGNTAPEIRNYLADRYANEPLGLDYVLLVGDAEHIPTFYGIGGTPSDHDYTTVDGDDYLGDFIIGRITGQTADDITTQVTKSVNYEREPPDADPAWFTAATTISGSDYYDDQNAEYCAQQAEGYGFDKVDRLLDSTGTNTKANLNDALAAGRSWISYFGHGWELAWSSVNPSYGNADVTELTNAGMLPAVSSIACSNGAYDYGYDCFAEAWMKAGVDKGAAAVFAAARLTPFFYTDSLGKAMARGYFQDGMDTFGAAAFYGKLGMYEEFPEPAGSETQEVMQHFHIFGDPELGVWSAPPAEFDEPDVELDGPGATLVITSGGVPVAGALVHIWNSSEFDVAGRTDTDGVVAFPSITSWVNTAQAVVTARNVRPLFDELTPILGADDDTAGSDDDESDDDTDSGNDDDNDGGAGSAQDDSNSSENGCGC